MVTKQRKRKRQIEEMKEDRISELPDCILHHVFSFADTSDVVRTCVLSKRWRYLWTSLPCLNFNFRKFSRVISSKRSSFINFIHQLLLRRNSIPIHTFLYSAPLEVKSTAVESWIYYAIKHQVQHLTIEADCCTRKPVQFPNCFYGCTSLTTLEIICCRYYGSITLPNTLKLSSLKNLHLGAFGFSDGNLFSTCPNLETLKLEDISIRSIRNFSVCALNLKSFDFLINWRELVSYSEIVIVAPKLKKFKFRSFPPKLLSFKNLSSLDQIEIDLPSISDQNYFYPIDELKQMFALRVLQMLNSLHIAQTMTLSMNVIQVLSYIPASLNEHPSQLSNLKYLKLVSSIPACIWTYFRKNSSFWNAQATTSYNQ
ncbi:F-box/LRR-repeat protein At3g26922-like isoform X2 [Mercurialis annua]|uniref:F-box/LRR-repeat protein At3g26922-like isoform X2 n=1 Tax=Mercurialis annua TaxID=3986 RepID=UPI002160B935|nr:F-box/LRR-repeat protein At3g26922-like isoform X2 [Mercurialis annua]